MAQASKRLRNARKLKRQLTLHRRELEHQMNLNDVYKQMLTEIRMQQLMDEKAKEQENESLLVKPTLGQIAQADGLDFRGEK